MTHQAHLRGKARALRAERKLTIDEIADRLALSRSTIYHWVRDLPIERDPVRASRAQKLGTASMVEKARRARRAAYEQGRAEFAELSQDLTFRDFVCMYIGEGYKRGRNDVAISNSDPVVISLCARWIERLTVNRIGYQVQYHADQDPSKLQAFWGFRLGIEPARVRTFRKTNSGGLRGRQWRCRHGVMRVSVGDTALRARIQAWIDSTMTHWTAG